MKALLIIFTALGLLIAISSCKEKCYDCTLKCGTCIKQGAVVAGCDGDTALQGFSIEAWKVGLESQGFTCTYDNDVQEACGEDNKKTLQDDHYTCLSK